MFSKAIVHPFFTELEKGLFSYSGIINIQEYEDVEVLIRGRSQKALEYASQELQFVSENLQIFLDAAAKDAYSCYEILKEVVDAGECDLEADGCELPEIHSRNESGEHIQLVDIIVDLKSNYPIRLGFKVPWDIEHDFGIYIKEREYEYSGVSV
jgi:hypothetical protein